MVARNILIVGSGKLGSNIANDPAYANDNIVLLDKNTEALQSAGMTFGGKIVSGDATNIAELKKAGIKNADIVIAATNNDNTNIFVSLIAKEIFNISTVIARLYEENRAINYDKLDIVTVCPLMLSRDIIQEKIKAVK